MRLIFLQLLVTMYLLAIYCQDYQFDAQFKSTDGEFRLRWSNDAEEETIQIEVCKFGDKRSIFWMGIGFSDRGETTNADLLAINIPRQTADDMHTTKEGKLQTDSENNYNIVGISTSADCSCFTVVRSWVSCDKKDYNIDRGTTNILLFTSSDQWSFLDGMMLDDFHPNLEFLQLIRSTIPINKIEDDTSFFEVVAGEKELLAVETTYWCKVIELPHFEEKNHIIKYEAIITEESKGIVHHMELFHCTGAPSMDMRNYDAPCNSENKPMGLTMCRKVIAAWAMGARAFTYPKDVGSPIGGFGFEPYAILEVHFNNPHKLSGIIDNSGLRIFHTSIVRKYDAGIIELGLEYVDKNSIPPGMESFKLSGFCVRRCLQEALPENGIFVFGSQLHTHLTGIKVETRHFRYNEELEPLNVDEHYQPHYQEIRLLPEIVNVIPGDSLVTQCSYRTTNRTQMTLGGIEITDEMCLNYIFYYPKIEFELCKSSISDSALEQFLGRSVKSLKKTFNEVKWTNRTVDLLSKLYVTAPIHQSCNMSDSQSYPGNWNFVQPVSMPSRKNEITTEEIKCYDKRIFDI